MNFSHQLNPCTPQFVRKPTPAMRRHTLQKKQYVMRSEEACPREERYLFCDNYLSDLGIEASKQLVMKRFIHRDKNDLYNQYINWKRNSNEIVVFTTYAYADLELNKEFDCIFNHHHPDEFVLEKFVVTQSLYEGWIPIDTVEHGHKHLLVLQFENEIPQLLFKLHREDNLQDTRPEIHAKLGFCTKNDFEFISDRLKKDISLKEKYGKEYWKYKDENE
jgi:hypothetical protein